MIAVTSFATAAWGEVEEEAFKSSLRQKYQQQLKKAKLQIKSFLCKSNKN